MKKKIKEKEHAWNSKQTTSINKNKNKNFFTGNKRVLERVRERKRVCVGVREREIEFKIKTRNLSKGLMLLLRNVGGKERKKK